MVTGPRALLDAYAAQETCECDWGHHATERDKTAPKAFAALRALLDYADVLDRNDLFAAPAHYIRQTVTNALEAT